MDAYYPHLVFVLLHVLPYMTLIFQENILPLVSFLFGVLQARNFVISRLATQQTVPRK